jgi:hypothetical protein
MAAVHNRSYLFLSIPVYSCATPFCRTVLRWP